MNKIARIRSNGQTGAARAALDTAKELGVPTCGWCSLGGMVEDSPPKVTEAYPELQETDNEAELNIRDSHATLIILPQGVECEEVDQAKLMARKYRRPYGAIGGIKDIGSVVDWLNHLGNGLTVNVIGPKASECKMAYLLSARVVSVLIKKDSPKEEANGSVSGDRNSKRQDSSSLAD